MILLLITFVVFSQENDIQNFWIEIEKLIETASTTELELETGYQKVHHFTNILVKNVIFLSYICLIRLEKQNIFA